MASASTVAGAGEGISGVGRRRETVVSSISLSSAPSSVVRVSVLYSGADEPGPLRPFPNDDSSILGG